MKNFLANRKGFSLLEVVITTLIVSIVFTIIVTIVQSSTKFFREENSQLESQDRLRVIAVDVEKDIRKYVFTNTDGTFPNNTTDFKKTVSGSTTTYILGVSNVTYVYDNSALTITRNGNLVSSGLASFSMTNNGSYITVSLSSTDVRGMTNTVSITVYIRRGATIQ